MSNNNFNWVVSFKRKLILLTPPKCSTYSLREFLVNGNIPLDPPQRPSPNPFYHPTLSEILYSYNIPIKEINDYKIIQVTRNPYDRFISSYYHQKQLLMEEFSINTLLNKLEQFKYLLPNNVDEFYHLFFQNIEYKWANFFLNQWGGVRFYFEQNWWHNNLDVNVYYLKLENLCQNSSFLCNLLNINNNPYPHLNKINPGYKLKNQIIKNRIYQLFKKDFEIFNYKQ